MAGAYPVFEEFTPVLIGAVFGGALRLCATQFPDRKQSARVFLAAILAAIISTSLLAKYISMKLTGYTLTELKFATAGIVAFAAHILLPRLDREIGSRKMEDKP